MLKIHFCLHFYRSKNFCLHFCFCVLLHLYYQRSSWCYWIYYCRRHKNSHTRSRQQCLKMQFYVIDQDKSNCISMKLLFLNNLGESYDVVTKEIGIRRITTVFNCLFTCWKLLANAIVVRLFNQPHIQCIVRVCFVLDFRIREPITNGKSLLKAWIIE